MGESVPAGSDVFPEEVLDRLYGGDPGDFVATRNAAAKDLKAAGNDEAARAVRVLRRPSAPAAAVNRAVRSDPAQARALLDAADDLRRAHEAVIGGGADRDALRAAVAAEAGGGVSADVERRIRDTLEAVALDARVRERFAAGTLESDARAAGLAADLAAAAPVRPPRRRGNGEAKRKAEREQRRLAEAVRRAEGEVERRREEVEAAALARDRADAALREARKRLREAEVEMRRARRAAP